MYRHIVKPLVVMAFGVLVAVPASAQVRAELGPLHIRIADEAPPRERYERRSAQPDRDSVWIRGYWDRQDDEWTWVSGRWERPAVRSTRWIRPRYRREGRAWRYEPAHWSDRQVVEGDGYRQWRDDQVTGRRRENDDQRRGDDQRHDDDRRN
jgi:hypothetical protein